MADIKNPERQGFESSGGKPADSGRFGEQVSETAGQTRKAAAAARDRVSEQAYHYADMGKQRLAEAIHDIAVSIREAGHKLHDEQQEGPAQYVDRTADQVKRMADYLQDRDVADLYDTIEDTARRHPGVFIGATFAAGLIAARFLRSSAERRRSGGSGRSLMQKAKESGQGASAAASEMFAEARQGGESSGTTPSDLGSSEADETPPPSDETAEGGEHI